mgnify:FL=1
MEKAVGKLSSDNHASCSGLPVLFGVSPYETKNEYLKSRIDARLGKNVRTVKDSMPIEIGNILEKPLIELTAEKLNLTDVDLAITQAVQHPDFPLEGSIDGIGYAKNNIVKPDNQVIYTEDDQEIMLDGHGIIEVKTTRQTPEADGKPPLFRGVLQTKALCAICGYSWGVVSTLHNTNDFKMFLLRRDFAFEKELKDIINDFERRIKEQDWYPPQVLPDLQIMHPVGEKVEVDLNDDDCGYHLDRINDNKAKIKLLNEEVEKSQIYIQTKMGEAEIGINDRYKVSWGTTTYKPQPEKVVPAKDGYTIRRKTASIKKLELE